MSFIATTRDNCDLIKLYRAACAENVNVALYKKKIHNIFQKKQMLQYTQWIHNDVSVYYHIDAVNTQVKGTGPFSIP